MPYRYFIVGITAVAALWLYIDRVCFSTLADPIQKDLGIPAEQKDVLLGAFFFTYALFQIPIGALADRYGPRLVLTVSIAGWSLVTAATGLAETFGVLLMIRLMLGVTESGAYPAAASLIKKWAKPEERGRFSSIVALGGRLGGFAAPLLTAWLAVNLSGIGPSAWMDNPSGVNWRMVLLLYGLCGLAVAVAFWVFVRNHPPIDESIAPQVVAKPSGSAWRPFLLLFQSRNMWFFGTLQFGVNLGWVFLVTLFPSYLNKVHGLPLEQIGLMQTVVLGIGCLGMLCGGIVTDMLRRKLGPRYGRSIPIAVAMAGCAVALYLVPLLSSVWIIVIFLGLMAFLVDMHNPSIWSFAQDVGGKNVGAALGFGNMWGNFGGFVSPILLGWVSREYGWDAVFMVAGAAFTMSTLCGLMLDARKPVEPEPAAT